MTDPTGRYEPVHTVSDWWDGPRKGIADYGGRPHFYESQWDNDRDDWADTFLLTPIDDPEIIRLALEDWVIWRRWEAAYHAGLALVETLPTLPEDRARHQAITTALEGKLATDPRSALCATADFRPRADPSWNGKGMRPLEARWTLIKSGADL